MKKVKCRCGCHTSGAIHFVACCDNGFHYLPETPEEFLNKNQPFLHPKHMSDLLLNTLNEWDKSNPAHTDQWLRDISFPEIHTETMKRVIHLWENHKSKL